MKIKTCKCCSLTISDYYCGDIALKIQMIGSKFNDFRNCVVTKKGQDQLIDFMLKNYQEYLKRHPNAK
jgi:hypothetical protein